MFIMSRFFLSLPYFSLFKGMNSYYHRFSDCPWDFLLSLIVFLGFASLRVQSNFLQIIGNSLTGTL